MDLSKQSPRKRKQIDKLIWQVYHTYENYDKIRYKLLKCYDIMCQHGVFATLSAKLAFPQIVTINVIEVQSCHYDLNKIELLTKRKKMDLPYALEEGYTPPEYLHIK